MRHVAHALFAAVCEAVTGGGAEHVIVTASVQRMVGMLYVHTVLRIPLFLVGPPGASKLLSVALFVAAMKARRRRTPHARRAYIAVQPGAGRRDGRGGVSVPHALL